MYYHLLRSPVLPNLPKELEVGSAMMRKLKKKPTFRGDM